MTGSPSLCTKPEVVVAHASDLHIDETYTAQLFGGDGTGGLRAVLEAAQKARADIVLLAGDTFECHRLSAQVVERTAEVMARFALPIVLLPGNHDPAIDEAVFGHPAFDGVGHLHVLGVTHGDAVLFDRFGVEVWGRPHRDYSDMDPLAAVRARSTPWQIAMAHGHYEPAPDRSKRPRGSWLIGDDEIASTKADYLALGHWNRRVKVGCGAVEAWYSGSPDYARSINVVRLRGDGRVVVEHEALDLPEGFGEAFA